MTTHINPVGDVITWIFTDHLQACRTFWTDWMAMTIEVTWDDDTGSGTMWRIGPQSLIEMKYQPGATKQHNVHVAIEVQTPDDVDRWFYDLTACGAPPVAAPAAQHYGHYNASVQDPAGIVVFVFARVNPSRKLSD